MKRRHFISSSLGTLVAGSLWGIEPIQRQGKSRLMLGLAAYSFRDKMTWSRNSRNKKLTEGQEGWSIFDFIDYCADHQVAAELTSYYFPPDANQDYMLKVRRHAYLRGVAIAGTAVGNSFTSLKAEERAKEVAYVKEWINHAATMGAPHIRLFAGPAPKDPKDFDIAVQHCIECYQECLDYAATKGVFVGLENHHGIVATPEVLVKIVRAVNSPWAGINLDSGHFRTEDPYDSLAQIAPYSVNVQLKLSLKRDNQAEREPVDSARVVKILRDANYQGWFTLEYEEKGNPEVEVPKILNEMRALIA